MAKRIMIQGTMSNAGKSIVTAGILRVLHQDGLRVAPFKSQNMALNSYITKEGLEMGRAQVMQAEAAGIEPSVLMNPILLKPTSDVGSQVIVNGEVRGNMSAMDYFRQKQTLIPEIMKAYRKLEESYDVIVIEGAGSPAEINLKENDIVNMGFAKLVDAPVLLVGDIDRGGVFAQLLGTVMLLEPEERDRIKGLVINKFRGDKTILDPGLTMLYEKCQIPITGVIPYVRADIDEEDSLTERFRNTSGIGLVDIAVVRLPHISNFTDFSPLEHIEGVSLRYVGNERELGNPDMILLPGTKNTMDDLKWLRESGLEVHILRAQQQGAIIMGICGGYQMLGQRLIDEEGVEAGGSMKGMGLLPLETIFTAEKKRTRISGEVLPSDGFYGGMAGIPFEGYEIHMGRTEKLEEKAESTTGQLNPFSWIQELEQQEKQMDGYVSGTVAGSYIHGIFDDPRFTNRLMELLFERKGYQFHDYKEQDLLQYKNEQYDMLADAIRKHMDMEAIYRILEQS